MSNNPTIQQSNNGKVLLLIILIVLTMGCVLSKDQSFSVDYNPEVGSEYESTVDFSDVMMKVVTVNDSICKYDISKNMSYSAMEKVFDETGGKIHRKNLLSLGDGNYKYYVKCKNPTFFGEPEELEIILRVNSLVVAQIVLDKNTPINTETVKVKLITSKVLSNTPSLTYSFDGKSYIPLVLIGSEKIWEGTIVFDNSYKEGVLSFNFKGNDLEGRQGTEITAGSYFEYDRIAPELITDINAKSLDGEIKLEWYSDDDLEEFKIYRSELPNPDYTDYYKTVDDEDYVDTRIEEGKTYYYRVSGVDEAGNEGDLSREVSGISISNNSVIANGLNPQFLGRVESLIIEINTFSSDVENLIVEFNSKDNLEKELFEKLGFKSKLIKAENDLSALKKSIERYKSQDLTEELLDNKINADRIKLGVIEKDIPNSFNILETKERTEDISQKKIEVALLETNGLLSEKERSKSVKETMKIIEDGLNVKSYFYEIEIGYLSGNKKVYSIVKRDIISPFEKEKNMYFVEVLPSSFSGFNKIEFVNRNYNVLKEDSVFTFETDTREIFYFGDGLTNFDDLEDIDFSFIKIAKEEEVSGITGFSVLNLEDKSYFGIFGIIIILFLFIYFFYLRGKSLSDDYFRMSNRINEATEKLSDGNLLEVKRIYASIKKTYLKLNQLERKKIYKKVIELYNEILIYEVKENLTKLKETKNKFLIPALEKKLNHLSKENQNKIFPLFEKIKGEVDLACKSVSR